MSWYDKSLSAIIMTTTVAYSACALSHIATMWTLRNEFEVAVRSPILAIVSGTVGALVPCFRIFRAALFPARLAIVIEGETVAFFNYALMITGPLVVFGFTCSYAFRGIRLLVMYNPHMRGRWKKFLKQQTVVKSMVVLVVLVEAVLWSANAAFGVNSMASGAVVAFALENLVIVTTCIMLAGQLRKAEDLFGVSQEIQRAGCCTLASLAILPLLFLGPVRVQPYEMQLHLAGKFYTALWFTNIQPIRTVLRQRGNYNKKGVRSFFPYVPWERSSKVVVDVNEGNSSTVQRRSAGNKLEVTESGLEWILSFPPLLQAFERFCVKALCIESLNFLVAVMEFQKSSADFENFTKIVDTFVRYSSPFEVNISSEMRSAILHQVDEARFAELSLDGKIHILDGAEKEVRKMLSENLVNKFRATNQYKDINALIFSAT